MYKIIAVIKRKWIYGSLLEKNNYCYCIVQLNGVVESGVFLSKELNDVVGRGFPDLYH